MACGVRKRSIIWALRRVPKPGTSLSASQWSSSSLVSEVVTVAIQGCGGLFRGEFSDIPSALFTGCGASAHLLRMRGFFEFLATKWPVSAGYGA